MLTKRRYCTRTKHSCYLLCACRVPSKAYARSKLSRTTARGICSISVGCSHLARRLSGPAFVCMRECAHLMKTEQPRDLGDMQLAVIEVTNRQIAPQLLKYFSEVQAFVRKPSCQRPLAHSQTAGNVFHEHPSMRKHRRDRVLNPGAQLAHVTSSIGQRRFAIFQEKVVEIAVGVNKRQLTGVNV